MRTTWPVIRASHVLMRPFALAWRLDTAEVIGGVAGGGCGVRPAAARAGVPDTTARGWVRRRGSAEHTSFDFLGFTFRARGMRTRRGRVFTGFGPAISKDALNKISAQVRSWRLHRHAGWTFGELAKWINPIVRGWMQYYGAFYRSALYPVLQRINSYLVRWLRKKYKRLRTFKKAHEAWGRVTAQWPCLKGSGAG